MYSSVNHPPILEMSKFDEQRGHEESVKYLGQYCNQLRETDHYTSGSKFKLTGPYGYSHLPEFPLNTEIPIMIEEQDEMTRKLRSLELAMKNFQGLGVYNAQPYVQYPSYPQWHAPTPQSHPQTLQTYQSPSRPDFWSKPNNEMRQKSRDRFTPIGESYVSSFQRLVQWGMITPLLGYISDSHSRSFDPNVRCAYHSDAQGHSIEDCHVLKREIEKMIQDESIMVQNTDSEKSSNYADMQINC
ncbi:hypothetical protein FXO37_00320 [Capsicum annuum]|nr:hypothetical protein FXO37_00320 [Capsicum annuum]